MPNLGDHNDPNYYVHLHPYADGWLINSPYLRHCPSAIRYYNVWQDAGSALHWLTMRMSVPARLIRWSGAPKSANNCKIN